MPGQHQQVGGDEFLTPSSGFGEPPTGYGPGALDADIVDRRDVVRFMTVVTAAPVSRVAAAATMRVMSAATALNRMTATSWNAGRGLDLSEAAQYGAGNGDIRCPRAMTSGGAHIPVVYMRRAITTRPASNSAAARMIMPRPM